MKYPNSYGSIIKLNGNLRKPFAIRVTIGYKDTGTPIRKYLGYYATRKEAIFALANYNNNPGSIPDKVTINQLYDIWSKKKFPGFSESTVTGYTAAFRYLHPIGNKPICDLRTENLNYCLKNCDKGKPTQKKIILLIRQLYELAMQNDLVPKDYSLYMDKPVERITDRKVPRQIFTPEEISTLWDNYQRVPYADTVLFLIYTGLRVGEFLNLTKEDFDFEYSCFKITNSKTKAGLRTVPISEKLMPIIQERFNASQTYFFEELDSPGKKVGYDHYYRSNFYPVINCLDLNKDHKPHDTRHTFATLLSEANANSTSIKKIIGHRSYATTLQTYTHTSIQELKKAVDLI